MCSFSYLFNTLFNTFICVPVSRIYTTRYSHSLSENLEINIIIISDTFTSLNSKDNL